MWVECNNSTKTWGKQSSLYLSMFLLPVKPGVLVRGRKSELLCWIFSLDRLVEDGYQVLFHGVNSYIYLTIWWIWGWQNIMCNGQTSISESSLFVCLRWPHPPTGFFMWKTLASRNHRVLNKQNKQKVKNKWLNY